MLLFAERKTKMENQNLDHIYMLSDTISNRKGILLPSENIFLVNLKIMLDTW